MAVQEVHCAAAAAGAPARAQVRGQAGQARGQAPESAQAEAPPPPGQALPPAQALASKPLAASRAAQELGLKRAELDLAVQLGHLRATPDPGTGRRRFAREEIDRLRTAHGTPEALRERVRTVGTTEGALLMSISPARFTRLARTGYISPVKFYLNRYRAVVWLYLAEDLRAFASREPGLLTGRSPEAMRSMLAEGEDWRARNWRARRLGPLTRQTKDPWERAAIISSVLDPVQLAEVVDDPYERAYLQKLRPGPAVAHSESAAAREVVGRLLLADDPDEILWQRVSLALLLDDAREQRSAPRPDLVRPSPASAHRDAGDPRSASARPAGGRPLRTPACPDGERSLSAHLLESSRGLRGWLHRRRPPHGGGAR
ncbi:DUF6397 family protein [Streptomyces sp. H27-C3]|uniref:DUF6397 family protein n=1 Tax=Streptomyces sp. H27-C3 TaxID=3046305 RepID=UPI0024BB4D41|nr:DUF6397 family protein [Streptomyces sp. H27-C3]MDJ0463916.1 DUF6397 family protein [Streptomyces sp. H27-C3]